MLTHQKYDTIAGNDSEGQIELVLNPVQTNVDTIQDVSTNSEEEDEARDASSILVGSGRSATVASSYINLASTSIGAGIIGIPYAFAKAGWVFGSILLFLGGLFSFIGSHLLCECARKVPSPATFYSVSSLTIPKYAFIVDILIAIKCVGVTTSYLFIIGDSMPLAMEELNAPLFLQNRMVCILLCCTIFCVPFSLYPKLHHLRFTSWLSGLMLLYLVLLIVLYSLNLSDPILDPCANFDNTVNSSVMTTNLNSDGYIIHSHSHETTSSESFTTCKGPQYLFIANFDTLKVLSIFVFNFSYQQNVFTVVNEMKNPTTARLNIPFALTFLTAVILYGVVTWCAYFTFGSNIISDILTMYPQTKLTTLCRISVSFIVSMHYPLQLNPARKSILSLTKHFGQYKEEDLSTRTANLIYYGATVGIFLLNILFASLFKDLGIVYQISGATGSTLVIFILPGLFYYIMHTNNNSCSSKGCSDFTRLKDDESVHHQVIDFSSNNTTNIDSGRIVTTSDGNEAVLRGETIKGPVWKLYLAVFMLVIGLILMPLSVTLIFLQL